MLRIILIAITSILAENIVCIKLLGIDSFIGFSRKPGLASGIGVITAVTMVIEAALFWLVYNFIMVPLKIEYLRFVAIIVLSYAIAFLIELILKKTSAKAYGNIKDYILTASINTAVMGILLNIISKQTSFFESVILGFASGIGFLIAIIMLSLIRDRIDTSAIPKAFQGIPIVLIAAGLLCLTFIGFQGLSLPI